MSLGISAVPVRYRKNKSPTTSLLLSRLKQRWKQAEEEADVSREHL